LTLKWITQLLMAFSPSAAAAALVAVLAVLSIALCLQIQSYYHYDVHCSWVEPTSHAKISSRMVRKICIIPQQQSVIKTVAHQIVSI